MKDIKKLALLTKSIEHLFRLIKHSKNPFDAYKVLDELNRLISELGKMDLGDKGRNKTVREYYNKKRRLAGYYRWLLGKRINEAMKNIYIPIPKNLMDGHNKADFFRIR